MNITPDQARELLDGATPGPWDASFDDEADVNRLYPWGEDDEIDDGDSWELARHAPDLAQTIAGMTWEYAAQIKVNDKWFFLDLWGPDEPWGPDDDVREHHARSPLPNTRLVRRLVGPAEVVDGD